MYPIEDSIMETEKNNDEATSRRVSKESKEYKNYMDEVDRLYHEYLKLWQECGGKLPDKLPGIHRSHYESFELVVDLTTSEESIVNEIDVFKKKILEARKSRLQLLERTYPKRAVVNGQPRRIDGKIVSLKKPIEIANKALTAYRQRDERHYLIACKIFNIEGSVSEKNERNFERRVRQYLAHAETLIIAAGNSTFIDALTTPLLKK